MICVNEWLKYQLWKVRIWGQNVSSNAPKGATNLQMKLLLRNANSGEKMLVSISYNTALAPFSMEFALLYMRLGHDEDYLLSETKKRL